MKKTFEILPFTADWLPKAAELLAARHARDRQALPCLPARYESPVETQACIQAALNGPLASGVAAVQGGRLLAYLIGEMVIDPTWGRSAWVRQPGQAAAEGQSPEILRDLYAVLGQRWLAYGCFFHFTLVSTADPALVNTWFSLSYGIEQVHGLLPLDAYPLEEPRLAEGVEIRPITPDDRAFLEDLSDVIWRHQVLAPVWGLHLPEIEAEQRHDWGALVEDPQVRLWLAFKEGQPVGCQGYFIEELDPIYMDVSDTTVDLGVAGVRPEARGLGISSAMTTISLNHARQAGFTACITDWRSTNLLSSRHWPRRGFQPVVYRLVRRIDPRITWANGAGIDFDRQMTG